MVLLLSGCGSTEASDDTQPVGENTTLFADVSEFPRMDGSTACLPLMAQVMSAACGIEMEEAECNITASKTSNSWLNLIYGNTDLLLVYEMPESVKEMWDADETPLEMTAIGRDALVFLVNNQNPVESLTQQQLIDIYTGKLTNWSQVGGEDAEIAAFQRDASSGSQTLFQKLLMKDRKPMEAPTEFKPGEMGILVESIAGYNNTGNAIGYSVYYYISEMKNDPGLRLLAVDGVAPTDATIADNSYSLTNEFYVAIRADEPEDSPTRQLYNWICGEEGETCLLKAGYVPAK